MAERSERHRPWAQSASARNAFGAVVSVVSLGGVLWWAAHQPPPRLPVDGAGLVFVVLALLAYAGITAARALRWNSILSGSGLGGYRRALELLIIGYMGNTVLPLRGGEVLRVLLLAREAGKSHARVIGTIVPERVLDAAALTTVFVSLTAAGTAGSPAGAAPAEIGAALVLLAAAALLSTCGCAPGATSRASPLAPVP